MPTGYTRSPKLLKGAIIRLGEGFLGPIPNIIVFQYNPEKLTTQFLAAASREEGAPREATVTTGEPYDPQETYTVVIEMDATDHLESPGSHPVTVVSGIADRIAALQMLVYPEEEDVLGFLRAVPGLSNERVPRRRVPVTLFIWGPGRILPVRITRFSLEEQAFSPTLFPLRATLTLELKVLKPESFPARDSDRTLSEDLAVVSYKYTKGLREVLARANLINSAESILAMLPF